MQTETRLVIGFEIRPTRSPRISKLVTQINVSCFLMRKTPTTCCQLALTTLARRRRPMNTMSVGIVGHALNAFSVRC